MFLGIDAGTTGVTAVLLNQKGKMLSQANVRVKTAFPKPGLVEQNAADILKSTALAVKRAIKTSGYSAKKIVAIGLTNQRETVGLFQNETPVSPMLVWQDRRTADFCASLSESQKVIHETTGLVIDPYFSASKIKWLLENTKRKATQFRTVDSLLIRALTGADYIEATNASRTQLMNIKSLGWSPEMLDVFEIPKELCPPILPSDGFRLMTKNCSFLPDGIAVTACMGDQQAALFGQLAWQAGSGKITFGTGSFILTHTGSAPRFSNDGILTTLARASGGGQRFYAAEGSAFVCGAWIQWLRDQLSLCKTSAQIEALAKKVDSSDGVFVIPALTGLGAPFWRAHARGLIGGLTRGSSRAHIAHASLEALAFQNRVLIDLMRDRNKDSSSWRVDGGASKNNILMQMQADALGETIIRPKNLEATATGIAWLAGLSAGEWSESDLKRFEQHDRTFRPKKNRDAEFHSWLNAARSL